MAKKKKRARLRIMYNAPVTLTFSLATVAVMVLEHFMPGFTEWLFTAPGKIGSEVGFDWTNVGDYFRLFTHVLGHQDWEHLLGNLSFILLLGPLLEERYGILTRCGLHCAPSAHKTLGTFPGGTVRFSLGFANTEDDVLAAASAIREISRL